MGIGKWVARKGAVGGTARFVAKAYRHCLENKLINLEDNDGLSEGIQKVVITALDFRFSGDDAHPDYCEILDSFNYKREEHQELNDTWARGLEDFVVCILEVEANFSDNTSEFKTMFYEIIDEELAKGGVAERFIRGY